MFNIKEHFSYSAACFERKKGQDNWDLCFSTDFDPQPYSYGKFALRVVMDGVSTENGGNAVKQAFPLLGQNLAGRLAASSMLLDFLAENSTDDNEAEIERVLYEIVNESFHEVHEVLCRSGCMTTLSVAVFFEDWLFTANIGDSPIYLIDLDETPLELKSVFTCQSEVQRKIDSGELTEEQALKSPEHRFVTGILGHRSSSDDINWRKTALPLNGMLLMGSDGALSYLTRADMAKLISENSGKGLAAINEAIKQQVGEVGGKDDFTLVIDEFSFY